MRLINAYTLLQTMDNKYSELTEEHKNTPDIAEAFILIDKLITEQPTVDAKPVVHGEWVKWGETITYHETLIHEKCSVCGRKVTRTSMQPQVNFCPNCGADMRKKGE